MSMFNMFVNPFSVIRYFVLNVLDFNYLTISY